MHRRGRRDTASLTQFTQVITGLAVTYTLPLSIDNCSMEISKRLYFLARVLPGFRRREWKPLGMRSIRSQPLGDQLRPSPFE